MPTELHCPGCQSPLPSGAEWCEQCGQEFCPACSSPLDALAAHCSTCGAEFELLCPACDREVAPNATNCPHCGLDFAAEDQRTAEQSEPEDEEAEVGEETRICPTCGEFIFLQDGFCRECGQELCPGCAQAIDEEDESCPHCGQTLIYDCPACGFEIMSGTEICPACHVVFPNFCGRCRAELEPGTTSCPACGAPALLQERTSARVLQTVTVATQRVPIVACPLCASHFTPMERDCPGCGYRLCPVCQIGLEQEEVVCPRCGLAAEEARQRIKIENKVE